MGTLSDQDRVRLRWRARRGLLENDLILTQYLDTFEKELTDVEVGALTQLFELGDNELLDLILARTEPEGALDKPEVKSVLTQLRAA